METLIAIIVAALSIELILHYRLHGRVANLSSRLKHAEVNIARMKTDISFLHHSVEQQDEEHELLRRELQTWAEETVKE